MTPTTFEERNGRAPVFRDVQEIMTQLRPPSNFNDPILAIDQYEAARILQGKGYPKHMHHASLPAVIALRKDQEAELRTLGYTEQYIPQQYPKMLMRRNYSPKFALKIDPGTKEPTNIEYLEERVVPSQAVHERMMRERIPQGCGPWCERLDEVEPIPDGPVEDPNLTIARLQGEVAGLATVAGRDTEDAAPSPNPKKKKGRPKKERIEEDVPVPA